MWNFPMYGKVDLLSSFFVQLYNVQMALSTSSG